MHIDTVKPWFETGDYPTQAQFHQWMEWLRWTDILISEGDLDAGLVAKINAISSAGRPERKVITGNTTIDMLAEFRFVHIWFKNPSAFNLVFHLNYPAYGIGDPWQILEVPANSERDFTFNKTFGTDTTLTCNEQTGVDFSATPVILRIDRK